MYEVAVNTDCIVEVSLVITADVDSVNLLILAIYEEIFLPILPVCS